MSVVVGYRGGDGGVCLASDGAVTGKTRTYGEIKVIAREQGDIVGWTGSPLWGYVVRTWSKPLKDRATIEAFALHWFEWARLRQHGDMVGGTYLLDGHYLIGTPSGDLFEISGDGSVCEHMEYMAIGSGEAVAMGAMFARKDIYGAVEAALHHDPGCGGGYNEVSILSSAE